MKVVQPKGSVSGAAKYGHRFFTLDGHLGARVSVLVGERKDVSPATATTTSSTPLLHRQHSKVCQLCESV